MGHFSTLGGMAKIWPCRLKRLVEQAQNVSKPSPEHTDGVYQIWLGIVLLVSEKNGNKRQTDNGFYNIDWIQNRSLFNENF